MKNVVFMTVCNDDDALTARNSMKGKDTGIVRISRRFSRAFDLKLTVVAHVVVIANGSKIRATEVTQMVGRGNRAQGIAEGTVII